MLARAAEVEAALSDPATLRDAQRLAELGREHRRLAPVVDIAARLRKYEDELAQVRELVLVDDPELAEEARAEQARLEPCIAKLEEELKPLVIPRDPLDDRNAIVEIRAGTGGDEAALFAADLYRMYERFLARNGFRLEAISEAAFKVVGEGAFGTMRWESGVHRVQRVPV